jgi:hypothetical protein
MSSLLDLLVDDYYRVDAAILRETVPLITRSDTIKHVKRVSGSDLECLHVNYPGFVVEFCVTLGTIRRWIPGSNYDKNYFCTFFYHGTSTEHDMNGGMLHIFNPDGGIGFLNDSLERAQETYEIYGRMAWLCFSSYRPYTGQRLSVRDEGIIPPNKVALIALGSVKLDGKELRALDCLMPSTTARQVVGTAEIVLVTYGEFVNTPS